MSRRRALAAALLAALSVAGAPPEARAHGRSTSTSSWELEPGVEVAARALVRVRWADLQRALPPLGGVTPEMLAVRLDLKDLVDGYLVQHAILLAGDTPCTLVGRARTVPSPDATHVARAWRVRCRSGATPQLHIDLFREVATSHVHLARARLADGHVIERVFVLDSPRFALVASAEAQPAQGSGFGDYLLLGIEHIATGFDHLTFLLALLLLGSSLRDVATVVTGFTIAHSVTLALGVLGVVEPQPAAIEALIGLSIVVVALENFALTTGAETQRHILVATVVGLVAAIAAALAGILSVPASVLAGIGLFSVSYLLLLERVDRPARLRWGVAFFFGLIHGFGFAGLLAEIGLPSNRVAPALLGFNLGVEAGQLAIVVAVWPVLRWALARDPARRPRLVQVGSAPVLAAGTYWFLSRALGGG